MAEQTKLKKLYGDDEALHPVQIEAFRRMTPTRKLQLAGELREAAWELKAAGLRAQHPDWSAARVQDEVREIFLYART